MELTKADNLAWRRFLQTEAGERGLLYLRERTPRVRATESHDIAFKAGVAEGYQVALDMLPEVLGKEQEKQIDVENR